MKRTVSNDHHTKIFDKLNNLYKEENSKGFALHMIRAYLPLHKTIKVFKSKKRCICSLCKNELFSVSQVIELSNLNEFNEDFVSFISNEQSNGNDLYDNVPVVKFNKGRELALTGENTTTYICPSCAKTFFDWSVSKMLQGDKKIENILNKCSVDDQHDFLTMFLENERNHKLKSNAEAMKNRITRPQKIVTTFGDLKVLQDLKNKMITN